MASEIDERFEFDAPRFYDFKTMTSGCSPADAWFDTAPEGPGMRPTAPGANREPFKNLQACADQGNMQQGAPKASQQLKGKSPAAAGRGADAGTGTAVGSAAANKAASNIVTSWGDATRPGIKRTRAQAEQAGTSTGASGSGRSTSAPAPPAAAAAPVPPALVTAGSQKAQRVSTGQAAPRVEPPMTRSMSRPGRLAFTPIPERKAKHFSPPKTRNARTAAKPRTPSHKHSARASGARLHAVLAAKITKPSRSTKPLTLPEDVELATTRRAARSHKACDEAPAASPFKSLAEKVLNFQSKTPERFRAAPKSAGGRPASAGGSKGRARPAAPAAHLPQCTEAKTPVLWTSTRSRPRRFKTREEEEEEEMQREGAFHARAIDPAVLNGAGATARKAPDRAPRQLTELKPFSFAVDQRAQSRSRGRASVADGPGERLAGGPQTRTRAAHMRAGGGRSILDGGLLGLSSLGTGAGPSCAPSAGRERPASAGRERPGLTIPRSPMLRTKIRHHSPPQQRELPKSEFKARPAPSFDSVGAKAVPFMAPKEGTQPVPFRLKTDDRHKLHEAQQRVRLAEERRREERQRRVSARPLPLTTDMPAVPPKPVPRDLTLPAPYRLRSEVRHAEAVQRHHEDLAREEEERRRAAEFKARPVWAGKPFTVHDSDAPLTVPDDVVLATEERAEDRSEFDRAVAEKMRAQEEERLLQEELKRQREEQEAKEYRRSLRFKARPMPNFDQPFFSHPSDKPLTNPLTPNFATKKRARRE